MATSSDVVAGLAVGKMVSAAALAERLVGLTRNGRLALFADIDGTISPIAAQPDAAFVIPEAIDALSRIAATGATVVLVTGRAADDARRMVGLDQLSYAGNHGFELLTDGLHVVRPEIEEAAKVIGEAVVEIEKLVSEAGLLGILFEDKRYTGSVHYRLSPDPNDAKSRLLPILQAVVDDRGLRLTEGRLVFEIRPSISMNKGVFVANYLEATPHGSAVFLGDDITDVDGFVAIQVARATGSIVSGLNVGVTAGESPQQVIAEADVIVSGTSEMALALTLFANRLDGMPDA